MPKAKPKILKIVEPVVTPGVAGFVTKGKRIASARPGTLLMLSGEGFGKHHDEVIVVFGTAEVEVLPDPLFSDAHIIVSVPAARKGKTKVKVRVAGHESNSVDFRIEPEPKRKRPPGSVMRQLLARCDTFSVLLANEIRIADFGVFATPESRQQLIDRALGLRRGLQLVRQRLETIDNSGEILVDILGVKDKKKQDTLRRIGRKAAEQSLARVEELVDSSQIVSQLDEANNRFRRGGSRTAAKVLEYAAIVAEGAYHGLEAAEGTGESFGGIFLTGETIPLIPFGTDLVGTVTFAATALEATAAVWAAGIATVAKIASEYAKNEVEQEEHDEIMQKLEKLEEKSDKIEQKDDKIERKLDAIESKLDEIEVKLDEIEPKLDQLEDKADKSETKLDYVEGKLDVDEIKKDQIESKLDELEPKVDRIESKLDYEEEKLDELEDKADQAEDKLDQLEDKADQAEDKLDKLEDKADYAEDKLDEIEDKLDQLEDKADKAEGKLDKIEPKLDNLEPKLDKLEPKLDNLEPKIDKIEPKLDQIQANQDRDKEFWQFSPSAWSVTNAKKAGVKLQPSSTLASPTTQAFSVESIQVLRAGYVVKKIIVDGMVSDVAGSNIVTPANVMVAAGIPLIGASDSVEIEFDKPYTGPLEFNGEKPQGLDMCTVVEGSGSSQSSPNPCK